MKDIVRREVEKLEASLWHTAYRKRLQGQVDATVEKALHEAFLHATHLNFSTKPSKRACFDIDKLATNILKKRKPGTNLVVVLLEQPVITYMTEAQMTEFSAFIAAIQEAYPQFDPVKDFAWQHWCSVRSAFWPKVEVQSVGGGPQCERPCAVLD